jgi:hypothetical protein
MREREIALEAYRDEYAKLKNNTYDILVLDTNYRTPGLISIFSDITIFVNPETFRNFSCLQDNIFLFPPKELRNRKLEEELSSNINREIKNQKLSLSRAISMVLR